MLTRSCRLVLVALLPLLGLAACTVESADPIVPSPTEFVRRELPTPTPRTMWVEIQLDPGSGETATLIANSDAIFVGTVLDAGDPFHRGERSEFDPTWTPFLVEVDEVLLGDVEGEVTVAQMGGLDPDENTRLVVLVDTPESMEELDPLEIGETYFFVTQAGQDDRPAEQDILFAEPIFGHVPIEDDTQRRQLMDEFIEEIESAPPNS